MKRFKTASTKSDNDMKIYQFVLDYHNNKDKPPLFTVSKDYTDFEQRFPSQAIVSQKSTTPVDTIGE